MPKILNNPKETILIEAKILLKEYGYRKFSMRELAKRSNIATGTLYNYYKNKFDIIREIFIDEWRKVISNLSNINYEDVSFEHKMMAIYDEIEGYLKDHMDIFMELTELRGREGCKGMKESMESLYKITDEIVIFHKEKGDIKLDVETRKGTLFLINNILLIIKNKYMTIEDLIKIVKM
ncbi:TetR/AcrR family transcriptional regulator [Clostridium chrysemydis]|uniref:TetR/AcrR family transcriptional regulator n=1 Tax=Clostridium chrysemydis TaxID=2665504 RepID=UPI001883EC8D|nr:TetR/AcrR family transcriptional regulator [Clostridium chrysemydis]